jgi:transcriptional regulator with XRE-family HTH domain
MNQDEWVTQEEIGERVRTLRQDRGLSQERLAHEAARVFWRHHPDAKMLTIHWVMRLENATTNVIDMEKLAAVAAALGVPLSRLVLPEAQAEPFSELALALRSAGMTPTEIANAVREIQERLHTQAPHRGDSSRQDCAPSDDTTPKSTSR